MLLRTSGIILCCLLLAARAMPQKTPPAPNFIYITFDDGPLSGSENIAATITQEGVKVNVFCVGAHIEDDARRKSYFEAYMRNPMIEVGNHSYSHAHNKFSVFYSNPNTVYEDFIKCYTQFKVPTKLCRLPGRNMWRTAKLRVNDMPSGADAADLLYKNGYKVIGWDLEWQHDDHTASPVQTVTDMLFLIDAHFKKRSTKTPGHLVLLAHDEMFAKGWEESELKQLLDSLKKKGNYQFAFLSQYPGL